MSTPIVGDRVHYVGNNGELFAAFVTTMPANRVAGAERPTGLTLTVATGNVQRPWTVLTNVEEGTRPGQWCWPTRDGSRRWHAFAAAPHPEGPPSGYTPSSGEDRILSAEYGRTTLRYDA